MFRHVVFLFRPRLDGAGCTPFNLPWHKLVRGDNMRCFSACPDATARIQGGADAPFLSGQIKFYQENGRVLVVTELTGLPQNSKTGFCAMHIHDGASCSGKDFSETQGHYSPGENDHPNHAGDLPSLMSYDGKAYLAVRTDRFCVRDVIGKTVVIHSNPDDFRSQPSGNSGAKIACGVICGN